jgi:hypothetical protein
MISHIPSTARPLPPVLLKLAQLPASLRYGTAFFVAFRLLWWLWGVVVVSLIRVQLPVRSWMVSAAAPLTGLGGWLLEPWNRWDVLWYVRIAVEGYSQADGRSAFGPLLPLLIRGLAPLMGAQPLAAAGFIADLACWGSLVLFYRVAEELRLDGRRVLIGLLSYPVAFFLFVPYADGLLLCCALAAWLAARTGRWPLAGFFGALAVLTKVTGLMLLVPFAWEAAVAWRAARPAGRRLLWQSAWLLLLPTAACLWPLVRANLLSQAQTLSNFGLLTPFVSADFAVGWSNVGLVWPWQALVTSVALALRPQPDVGTVIAAVHLAVAVWAVAMLARTPRLGQPGLTLFVGFVILANLVFVVIDNPLIDAPRRWLLAFPLFLAASQLPISWTRLWMPIGLTLQLALATLFIGWLMVG